MLMSVYKLSTPSPNGHGNALVQYHLVLTERCSGAVGNVLGCTLVFTLLLYSFPLCPSCVARLLETSELVLMQREVDYLSIFIPL